mmetsp:Transcript_12681/g.19209  ORF Transcript_12681/g.19209 Transcript_12681/m.19209 type:complete len:107 (-) Transcript_12681:59-379(-)
MSGWKRSQRSPANSALMTSPTVFPTSMMYLLPIPSASFLVVGSVGRLQLLDGDEANADTEEDEEDEEPMRDAAKTLDSASARLRRLSAFDDQPSPFTLNMSWMDWP